MLSFWPVIDFKVGSLWLIIESIKKGEKKDEPLYKQTTRGVY